MSGIEPTNSFGETLKWWTGPWCYDLVPYYRPSTSLCFWLEYKAFGPQGLQGFTAVHLVSHLVLVVLLATFLSRLVGWRTATVTMAIYGLHLPRLLGLGDSSAAFPVWKDSCDIWCAICYVLSLHMLLRYLDTNNRSHLAVSIGCFLVAITFKEMAYTVPATAVLLLWYRRTLPDRWRLALPYVFTAAVAFAYRAWALNGLGFKNGTNGAWWYRTIVDLGGPPAKHVLAGGSLPVAVALAAGATVIAMIAKRRNMALGLGFLSCFFVWLAARQMEIPIADVLLELLVPTAWPEMLFVAFCLLLAAQFVYRGSRTQRFGYGWVVITHMPLVAMPVGEHGFYMVAIGWSIWLTEVIKHALTTGKLSLRSVVSSASSHGEPQISSMAEPAGGN